MRSRALIFDLDGTLLDSLADIGESMNSVLASMGLPTHPLSDYRAFVGDGVTMLATRALPEGRRDDASLAACLAGMREIYAGRATSKTRPYDGIPALLDALAKAGLPMAVVSNKPHDLTCRLVSQLLGRWRFGAVFGERAGVPRKPDPASALEAASCLGVAPADVLYVGDTATDMATATAAGMRPLGVSWGFRGEDELRAAGAFAIAARPADVLEALDWKLPPPSL
jgi:phosphoglycolate phosphatase